MALKFFFLVLFTTIVKGEASVPAAAPLLSDATYDPLPQYYFGYDVQDALTGDSKTQVETRNGDVVLGQYSLNDPDGTRRIVDYTSDAINGFNAVVRKTPLAFATPIVARASLTPVLEPAAVRAVATPLVAARALPTSLQPVGPLLRSTQAVPANPSPSAAGPQSPLSRSAEAPSNAPLPSPSPSSVSVASFNVIRSPSLQRSSNPLPSPNLPSLPQLRAALNSPTSLPAQPADLGQATPQAAEGRSAAQSASLSESVEINAATLESGPAAPQTSSRNAPVAAGRAVAASPLVAAAPGVAAPRFLAASPIAYAAAPVTYSVAPLAYNVW